nr:ninjurin-1 isoform X1 [Equus caballus]
MDSVPEDFELNGELHPGSLDSPDVRRPRRGPNRPINVNHYANKKSAAESMLDIALLMANASQLKAVVEQGPSFAFFFPLVVLISISLLLQICVGVLLIFLDPPTSCPGASSPLGPAALWAALPETTRAQADSTGPSPGQASRGWVTLAGVGPVLSSAASPPGAWGGEPLEGSWPPRTHAGPRMGSKGPGPPRSQDVSRGTRRCRSLYQPPVWPLWVTRNLRAS